MSTYFVTATRALDDLNLPTGTKAEFYFYYFKLVKAQAAKEFSYEVVRNLGHGIAPSFYGERVQTKFYMFG